MAEKKLSFEENLQKFEEVIRNLENKDISLEDAVKNYTLGLELSKICLDILNENEQLVVEQMTQNGLTSFKGE